MTFGPRNIGQTRHIPYRVIPGDSDDEIRIHKLIPNRSSSRRNAGRKIFLA